MVSLWGLLLQSCDVDFSPKAPFEQKLGVFSLLSAAQASARWEFGSGLPFTQSVGFYDRVQFVGAFDSTFVGEDGAPYTILGRKNQGRLPMYHRFDVNLWKAFRLLFARFVAELSIVNVYDRWNMFYFNRSSGERVDQLPALADVQCLCFFLTRWP